MSVFKKLSLLTFIVASLVAVCVYMSAESSYFPEIEDGNYVGQILIDSSISDYNNLDFYVHKEGGSFGEGGIIQIFSFSDQAWKSDIKDNTYKAITPLGELIFAGSEEKNGYYRGTLKDTEDRVVATWILQSTTQAKQMESIQEVQSLNQLLSMSSELQEIESKIKTRQITVEQQKGEIERLGDYLNEGKSLKTNADKKYQEKKAELEHLISKKESKLKEAENLREKFEISQRLFGVGKLVHLSRTVQDYETRWFESMSSSYGTDTDGAFEELVERAERIRTLKKEISYELNKYE